VEIVIVACLSSFILLAGALIMNRSTRSFKKGSDMMNSQMLMDSIVGRLRSDVRSLKRLIKSECSDMQFSFVTIQEGKETQVRYVFSRENKTLSRIEEKSAGPAGKTDFHGAGQVESFLFQPMPLKKEFAYLNVAMMVKSDEKGEGGGSRLSIVCQFRPVCLEPTTPFGR
jgi:hypothetical protein